MVWLDICGKVSTARLMSQLKATTWQVVTVRHKHNQTHWGWHWSRRLFRVGDRTCFLTSVTIRSRPARSTPPFTLRPWELQYLRQLVSRTSRDCHPPPLWLYIDFSFGSRCLCAAHLLPWSPNEPHKLIRAVKSLLLFKRDKNYIWRDLTGPTPLYFWCTNSTFLCKMLCSSRKHSDPSDGNGSCGSGNMSKHKQQVSTQGNANRSVRCGLKAAPSPL